MSFAACMISWVFASPAWAASSTGIIPNDPHWQHEWYLRQIHMPEAWISSTGSASVIVAVLDTGIDILHQDIKDNIWMNTKEIPGDGLDNDQDGYVDDVHGWNFVTNRSDLQPLRKQGQSSKAMSHGTAVASLIGGRGNDGIGMAGVAWNVRLMPLVILDADGAGTLDGLMEAIRYAVSHGASIINLSLAGLDYDEQLDQLMRRAALANVTIVAATGNDGRRKSGLNIDETPTYPACMDGSMNAVLGVSGTDTLDQKAPYANAGQVCTDLSAPGHDIFAARPQENSGTSTHPGYMEGLTGTSVAAPLVSGVAALIKSLQPSWTAEQIRHRLIQSTDPIEDSTVAVHGRLGSGRLNAAKAVQGLLPTPIIASVTTTTSTPPMVAKPVAMALRPQTPPISVKIRKRPPVKPLVKVPRAARPAAR